MGRVVALLVITNWELTEGKQALYSKLTAIFELRAEFKVHKRFSVACHGYIFSLQQTQKKE